MSAARSQRLLHAVPAPEERPSVTFCGHCGAHAAEQSANGVASRVCGSCDLGLLVQARASLAPSAGDPFVMINGQLVICGLSESAEEMLGISESEAVNRHIAEFLMPADAEARGPDTLVSAILAAATADGEPQTIVVRPSDEFGVRLWVRVGSCGPPRAALLVLSDARS